MEHDLCLAHHTHILERALAASGGVAWHAVRTRCNVPQHAFNGI